MKCGYCSLVLTRSLCRELTDFDKHLRNLHMCPKNVAPLISSSEPFTYTDIARALLHQAWPRVSTGKGNVIDLPQVPGGMWIKVLEPLGKIFGIGPNSRQASNAVCLDNPQLTPLLRSRAMLSPHDLVNATRDALERTGMVAFPTATYNKEWHFSFKKWQRVVNWKGRQHTQQQQEEPSSTSSDVQVIPKKRKTVHQDPQTIDYTQVSKDRDADIATWAGYLGFEIKNGRIDVEDLWDAQCAKYLNDLPRKISSIKETKSKGPPNREGIRRRWERWAEAVDPHDDLHRVRLLSSLFVCTALICLLALRPSSSALLCSLLTMKGPRTSRTASTSAPLSLVQTK